MKLQSYNFSSFNITKDLKNKWVYLFCLESGNISRINKFIPITKVKFKKHLATYTIVFEDDNNKELQLNHHDFYVFETLEEAQAHFKLVKQKEIDKLQVSIDSIMKLQEKIRKL